MIVLAAELSPLAKCLEAREMLQLQVSQRGVVDVRGSLLYVSRAEGVVVLQQRGRDSFHRPLRSQIPDAGMCINISATKVYEVHGFKMHLREVIISCASVA